MIVAGFIIMLFAGCLISWAIEENKKALIVGIVILSLSILMVIYDGTSPVQIESERTFQTNNYQEYDLNINNDKLGIVNEIKYRSVFPGAIFNNETKYYFIDFKENK